MVANLVFAQCQIMLLLRPQWAESFLIKYVANHISDMNFKQAGIVDPEILYSDRHHKDGWMEEWTDGF